MAKIFTTPEAEKTAKIFMHDVTVLGNINTNNLRTHTPYSWSQSSYRNAAAVVCDELVNRDFADIDPAIKTLRNYAFPSNFNGTGKYKRLKEAAIAKSIVFMAEQLQLYWDDTVRTPFEIDEFKKTLLGEAVYKYGRVISAIPDKSSGSKQRATSTKTPGQPPKNNYKQSGPQSGNVRDLLGNPGDKVKADTNFIYKIIADKTGKNTPNVFIKPLSSSGAAGNTNKIFISSGNGYTDCTCYFDDPNAAQDFLDKIIASNRVPANVTNLRVVKLTADANGYFLVGTEFGTVAISAKTLNEALKEAFDPIEDTPNEKVTEERTVDWEKATENATVEELNELHTWMRRG